MNRIRVDSGKDRLRWFLPLTGLLLVLLWAMATNAKMTTDFNPNLDFSKYRTFAYIGGVESLVRMQLNPELLNNRIHRAVVRELTGKGLWFLLLWLLDRYVHHDEYACDPQRPAWH
jgi:hypothetical protein